MEPHKVLREEALKVSSDVQNGLLKLNEAFQEVKKERESCHDRVENLKKDLQLAERAVHEKQREQDGLEQAIKEGEGRIFRLNVIACKKDTTDDAELGGLFKEVFKIGESFRAKFTTIPIRERERSCQMNQTTPQRAASVPSLQLATETTTPSPLSPQSPTHLSLVEKMESMTTPLTETVAQSASTNEATTPPPRSTSANEAATWTENPASANESTTSTEKPPKSGSMNEAASPNGNPPPQSTSTNEVVTSTENPPKSTTNEAVASTENPPPKSTSTHEAASSTENPAQSTSINEDIQLTGNSSKSTFTNEETLAVGHSILALADSSASNVGTDQKSGISSLEDEHHSSATTNTTSQKTRSSAVAYEE